MKVSIVTPSLNQGRYIREALESVLAQDYSPVEHRVLDGGSSDETIPFLQGLHEQPGWNHLSWISESDDGQSEALNRGFEQATGDIVGWLNSDDRYRAGCFRRVIQAFADDADLDVVYGDFAVMDHDGTHLYLRREIEFSRFILLYHRVSYIPTPATFFRSRVFHDGHRLNPDLHYAMDYEFFLRLARSGYKTRHIPCLLADFRIHPESKSCSRELLQAQEKQQIMISFSPITQRITSPFLRSVAFSLMQSIASLMRYSEKAFRGYYFSSLRPKREPSRVLPPHA